MSKAELAVLNPVEIDAYETSLRPFLVSACARSLGRYSPETVLNYARRGLWQIWLIWAGDTIRFVGATEIVLYDTGLKALEIRFGIGPGMRNWAVTYMDTVLAWGRAQGCTLAEGAFRIGWRRVLQGWIHSHDHLERLL